MKFIHNFTRETLWKIITGMVEMEIILKSGLKVIQFSYVDWIDQCLIH